MALAVHWASAMFAALIATAVLAGLSSLHCAAMCGPLANCVSDGEPRRALRYHFGRVVGYGTLGATAGGVGALLPHGFSNWLAAITAWVAAVALLIIAYQLWSPTKKTALVELRPAKTRRSSQLISWLSKAIAIRPTLAGTLTALLPCGVLWAAVAIAVSSGSLFSGAVVMAFFAVLSGVSIAVASFLLAAFGRGVGRRALAAVFALSAVAFVILPLPRLAETTSADAPACPLHPEGMP